MSQYDPPSPNAKALVPSNAPKQTPILYGAAAYGAGPFSPRADRFDHPAPRQERT